MTIGISSFFIATIITIVTAITTIIIFIIISITILEILLVLPLNLQIAISVYTSASLTSFTELLLMLVSHLTCHTWNG